MLQNFVHLLSQSTVCVRNCRQFCTNPSVKQTRLCHSCLRLLSIAPVTTSRYASVTTSIALVLVSLSRLMPVDCLHKCSMPAHTHTNDVTKARIDWRLLCNQLIVFLALLFVIAYLLAYPLSCVCAYACTRAVCIHDSYDYIRLH